MAEDGVLQCSFRHGTDECGRGAGRDRHCADGPEHVARQAAARATVEPTAAAAPMVSRATSLQLAVAAAAAVVGTGCCDDHIRAASTSFLPDLWLGTSYAWVGDTVGLYAAALSDPGNPAIWCSGVVYTSTEQPGRFQYATTNSAVALSHPFELPRRRYRRGWVTPSAFNWTRSIMVARRWGAPRCSYWTSQCGRTRSAGGFAPAECHGPFHRTRFSRRSVIV